MIGIALKLAMYPLHLWLPNAYTYAPSVVTVFLAATATKVAIYIMLRVLFTIFPNDFLLATPTYDIFILSGIAAIIIASIYAIYQSDIKKLLAYSSVAQIGYIALGIGFASSKGIAAALIHVFNHALMKAALFMAVGAIIYRIGSCNMKNINGLGKQMPWTFAAIVIAGLSLIGIPGTAGFISKWYLQSVKEAPLMLLVPLWVLVCTNIYFGLDTSLTVGVAERAADVLVISNTGVSK